MNVGEHGFEPQPGLPEPLPRGERLLWQGRPDAGLLARRVFHVRKLALYFAMLIAWSAIVAIDDGAAAASVARRLLGGAALGATAIGLLALIAWLTARSTVYSVTDRRVVMRFGVVLNLSFNLPLRQLDAVRARLRSDGSGDVALPLRDGQRIAYLHLWPHARPWCWRHPEPALRAVPQAQSVARLLAAALARSAQAEEAATQAIMLSARTTAPPDDAVVALRPWPRAA